MLSGPAAAKAAAFDMSQAHMKVGVIPRKFTRKKVLGTLGGLSALPLSAQEGKADFTLHIGSASVYRLVLDNRTDEAHPLHLHRDTFELAKIGAAATSGVWKDVVFASAMTKVELNLTVSNPGPTLFQCHNQIHMDYGYMTMFQYM